VQSPNHMAGRTILPRQQLAGAAFLNVFSAGTEPKGRILLTRVDPGADARVGIRYPACNGEVARGLDKYGQVNFGYVITVLRRLPEENCPARILKTWEPFFHEHWRLMTPPNLMKNSASQSTRTRARPNRRTSAPLVDSTRHYALVSYRQM